MKVQENISELVLITCMIFKKKSQSDLI